MKKVCLLAVLLVVLLATPVLASGTYGNMTLIGPTQEQVVDYLNSIQMVAYVSETVDRKTVIYDEGMKMLESEYFEVMGKSISEDLHCVVVSAYSEDSDYLAMIVHKDGKRIWYYNSWPEYYSSGDEVPQYDDLSILSTIFGFEVDTELLEKVLAWFWTPEDNTYILSEDRHYDITCLLELPEIAVDLGYYDLEDGDGEMYDIQFTKIGDIE